MIPQPTVSQQLTDSTDALKIAEVLSARGVEAERAKRIGEMAITMADPGAYDAAVWWAAERIALLLEPRADEQNLRAFPSRVRQLYLTTAMHAIRGFEQVLTRSLGLPQITQCFADYHSHRDQLLARTLARRLAFPKAVDVHGNAIEGED